MEYERLFNYVSMGALGDGLLYRDIHQQDFIFDETGGKNGFWNFWNGHFWQEDFRHHNQIAVENVSRQYLELKTWLQKDDAGRKFLSEKFQDPDDQKEFLKTITKKIKSLRNSDGRRACLEFAHTCENGLSILSEQFDCQTHLLPVQNGVLDLRLGEISPGRQSDFLKKAATVEWQGCNAPCPNWKRFLLEIMDGREEMVTFLQRIFGMALADLNRQAAFFILIGRGRNGKTLMFETISNILGNLAGPIRIEMLLDSGMTANPDAPTPSLVTLKGLRMAFAQEPSERATFSTAKVKWLTGRDTLRARLPYAGLEMTFNPSHTLFISANNLPHFDGTDFAFKERCHVIPFEFSYVAREPRQAFERRADPDLPNKLKEEYPGILAWLVQGAIDFIGEWKGQIVSPAPVLEATSKYYEAEDWLQGFLDACCIIDHDPETKTGATVLHHAFCGWWIKHVSAKPRTQRVFGAALSKIFKRGKSGDKHYEGLTLNNVGYDFYNKYQVIIETRGNKETKSNPDYPDDSGRLL
jgi:putative DNA primase/helicase